MPRPPASVLAPLLSALLLSCSVTPSPVLRLSAVADETQGDVHYDQGLEIHRLQGERLRLYLGYLESSGGLFAFDVEVVNEGEDELLVSPEQFRVVDLDGERNALAGERVAVDPEERLLELDKMRSRSAARQVEDGQRRALTAVVDAFGDAARIGDGRSDEDWARWHSRNVERNVEEMNDRSRHAEQSSAIGAERLVWSQRALRRTTVPPGHAVAGTVFVQARPGAEHLLLSFEPDGERLQLLYRVESHSAVDPASRPANDRFKWRGDDR